MKRLIVAITGASGAIYGIRALELLRAVADVETHVILTPSAQSDHRARDRLRPDDVTRTRRPRPPPPRHRRGGVVGLVRHDGNAGRAVLGQDAQRNRQLLQRRTGRARGRRVPEGAPARRAAAPGDATARRPHRPDGQGDGQRRDHHAAGSRVLRVARDRSTTSSIRRCLVRSSCWTSRFPVSNVGMEVQSHPTSSMTRGTVSPRRSAAEGVGAHVVHHRGQTRSGRRRRRSPSR